MDIKQLYAVYQQHPVVTTDSRNCPEGSIFIALKGASFDGNKFAASALEKGCSYAVVDEKEYCVEGDDRYILTDDCLTTFKELAESINRKNKAPSIKEQVMDILEDAAQHDALVSIGAFGKGFASVDGLSENVEHSSDGSISDRDTDSCSRSCNFHTSAEALTLRQDDTSYLFSSKKLSNLHRSYF